MRNAAIHDAKARIDIAQLWNHFGMSGVPGKICRSPFRDDVKPSFSIYAEGRRWHDFGTGESGDAVDFIAKARACDLRTAARELIELASYGLSVPVKRLEARSHQKRVTFAGIQKDWPRFETPTACELLRIAEARGFSTLDGLHDAVRREMLYCTSMVDAGECVRAWILTDPLRSTAQARRLDGRKWENIGAKAKTLRGSCASWPVGAAALDGTSLVFLLEGAPDVLAAMTLGAMHTGNPDTLSHFGFCGMLGAGMNIHADALDCFRGKRVRIVPQLDGVDRRTGELAALRWGRSLASCGVSVDVFNLDGLFGAGGGKDLNDALCAAACCRGGADARISALSGLFGGGSL